MVRGDTGKAIVGGWFRFQIFDYYSKQFEMVPGLVRHTTWQVAIVLPNQ